METHIKNGKFYGTMGIECASEWIYEMHIGFCPDCGRQVPEVEPGTENNHCPHCNSLNALSIDKAVEKKIVKIRK